MVIGYGASDRESFATSLTNYYGNAPCDETSMTKGDQIDNDCDGAVSSDSHISSSCLSVILK